jgi:hypothetical protein
MTRNGMLLLAFGLLTDGIPAFRNERTKVAAHKLCNQCKNCEACKLKLETVSCFHVTGSWNEVFQGEA